MIQPDLDAGLIGTNGTLGTLGTASAQADGVNGSGPATATDTGGVSLVQAPSITVSKSPDIGDLGQPLNPVPGTVTFTYVITNTGNVSVENVTLNDDLEGPISLTVALPTGSLAPTESTTVTVNHVVSQADLDAGRIGTDGTVVGQLGTASAQADGVNGSGPTLPATDPGGVLLLQTASITVTKSGTLALGTDGATPGDVISYTFTVTNTGNTTLSNVTVTDPLVTVSGPATPLTLAPGAIDTGSFTGSYSITQADIDAGNRDNIATATGTPPASVGGTVEADGSASVPVPQTASISVTKTARPLSNTNAPIDTFVGAAGDDITYDIDVTNTGNVTLTNVTVTDAIADVTVLGGPIASLAVGTTDTTTFSATYTITAADIAAGSFANVATASAEAPGGDPTDPTDDITDVDGVTVGLVNLSLAKSASITDVVQVQQTFNNSATVSAALGSDSDSNNVSSTVVVASNITYTLTVTNSGV